MIQEITSILNNLRRIDGVTASVILDRDGLLIASEDSTQKGSAEELASLFARAIHSFERKTRLDNSSANNGIEQMIIERQGNEKLILAVSALFILAVVTQGNINLGLIQIEMKDTIKLLTPLLE